MKLRDILVVLDNPTDADQRLAVALRLAAAHGARLTGFSPLDLMETAPPVLELAGYGEAMRPPPDPEAPAREAAETETGFRAALGAAGVDGEWIGGDADPPAALIRLAHHADLVVFRQPDPDSPKAGRMAELIEHVLLQAGRPLLLIPYAGRFEAVGRNVLIAWTDTRESARAVADALPLLAGADQVTALTIVSPGDAPAGDEPPAAALARHLRRHGVPATAQRSVTEDIPDADALLSYTCDLGADLLVMGGYGHSPLRERMLGGVTRSLLRHMTVPVLMSH
ncbi:MAG: universal stress protein [Rhodospirillales bacterium]|nr:universal stress protein [Rhodospirillales bacterium]